jgi:hypothetical protein
LMSVPKVGLVRLRKGIRELGTGMVTKQSLSVGSRESIGTLVFSSRQQPKLRELSRGKSR